MNSLEEAFFWLNGLPDILDIEIVRTNRTGQDSDSTGRNIHGQKTLRNGDWQLRIDLPAAVPGRTYHTAAMPVAYAEAEGADLLTALNSLRQDYETYLAEHGPDFESFDYETWLWELDERKLPNEPLVFSRTVGTLRFHVFQTFHGEWNWSRVDPKGTTIVEETHSGSASEAQVLVNQ